LHHSIQSRVELRDILDLGAFDLSRALRIDPELLVDATHEHDPSVGSVSLKRMGSINESALNRWLFQLVQSRGPDLYRMKGILNVAHARRRFVLQGVHMLLDGRPGAAWGADEPRTNHLVLIGKHLDQQELARSFEACFEPVEQSRDVA
jgi:G3E family GTPase